MRFCAVTVGTPGRATIAVPVEAFDASGHFVGDADFALDPGSWMVKLLFELIPETAGQRAGSFRVFSPASAVESFALFGDLTGAGFRRFRGNKTKLPAKRRRHKPVGRFGQGDTSGEPSQDRNRESRLPAHGLDQTQP